MTGVELYDPGLQPERTALAWRRTALSLAVGSMVSLRVLPEALNHSGWMVLGLCGVLGSGLLWVYAGRRNSRIYAALRAAEENCALPGGGLLAATAAVVLLAAIIAIPVALLT